MFRVNAFTQKGTKFRFRVQSDNIQQVHQLLDQIFADQKLRLVLVEPI